MSEEEGTGMRIVRGVFIICEVVLDHLATKIHLSVEAQKKRTCAYIKILDIGLHP